MLSSSRSSSSQPAWETINSGSDDSDAARGLETAECADRADSLSGSDTTATTHEDEDEVGKRIPSLSMAPGSRHNHMLRTESCVYELHRTRHVHSQFHIFKVEF
jgi:hypothetical protein